MVTKIKTIKDSNGDTILPRTSSLAVTMQDGSSLDSQLAEKANKVQEAWITPTLLSGATGDIQYRKNQFGRVEFRGKVTQSTTGSGLFNLATGYFDNITQRVVIVADDGTVGSLLQTNTTIFLSSTLAGKIVSLNAVSFIGGS